MDLDNRNLYKKNDQLMQLKQETYEKLFNRCKNTIKLTSDAGELICLFEIPSFLFGSSYPFINIEVCAEYIINKLAKANNNIKTTFIEPNMLFIDWRRESDIQYHQVNKKRAEYIPKKSTNLYKSERYESSNQYLSPNRYAHKK